MTASLRRQELNIPFGSAHRLGPESVERPSRVPWSEVGRWNSRYRRGPATIPFCIDGPDTDLVSELVGEVRVNHAGDAAAEERTPVSPLSAATWSYLGLVAEHSCLPGHVRQGLPSESQTSVAVVGAQIRGRLT